MRSPRFRFPRVEHAFELFIAWLCIGSGAPMALGAAPPPNSIERSLPGWMVHCWGATLFVGGLLIVVGIALRRREPTALRFLFSLRVEGAGLLPLAAATSVFGIVITATGSWRSVFGAGTYLLFALACLCRIVTIRDAERGLRSAVQKSAEEQ